MADAGKPVVMISGVSRGIGAMAAQAMLKAGFMMKKTVLEASDEDFDHDVHGQCEVTDAA